MSSGSTTSSSIVFPTCVDILCGRDKKLNRHEGNKILREQILPAYVDAYNASDLNKNQKMVITKEIVQRVAQCGSRFLRYSQSAGQWEELSESMARERISHALKNAYRKKLKKQGEKRSTTCRERIEATCTAAAGCLLPPRDACLMGSLSSVDTTTTMTDDSTLEEDCGLLELSSTHHQSSNICYYSAAPHQDAAAAELLQAPILEAGGTETTFAAVPMHYGQAPTAMTTVGPTICCPYGGNNVDEPISPIRLFHATTSGGMRGESISPILLHDVLQHQDEVMLDETAIASLLSDAADRSGGGAGNHHQQQQHGEDGHNNAWKPALSSLEPLQLSHLPSSDLVDAFLNDEDNIAVDAFMEL